MKCERYSWKVRYLVYNQIYPTKREVYLKVCVFIKMVEKATPLACVAAPKKSDCPIKRKS